MANGDSLRLWADEEDWWKKVCTKRKLQNCQRFNGVFVGDCTCLCC